MADAEPRHHAGAVVVDHDVRLPDQTGQDVAGLGVLQVERDALLVAAAQEHRHGHVVVAVAAQRQPVRAEIGGVVAGGVAAGQRVLHLDDPGAEPGQQQRRVRSGQRGGQIDHRAAGEQAVSHAAPPRLLPMKLRRQARLPRDALDVRDDPPPLLVVTERHRPPRVVDPAGHEACRHQAVPVEPADRDRGVPALGMEGVVRHVRIGREAVQLDSAARPRGTFARVARGGRQRVSDGHEVAQAVIDRPAAVHLDAAHDVGVVGEHGVRAGVDRGVRHGPLVHRQHGGRVPDTLVQRHRHDVGLGGQGRHVLGHPLQRGGVGEGVDGGRPAGTRVVELVVGQHLYVCAAGLAAGRPGLAGTDAVVAEHPDPQAVVLHHGGAAGLFKGQTGARGGQSRLGRILDRVGHPLVAGVVDVVARERHHVETRLGDRRQRGGIGGRGGDVGADLGGGRAVGHLDVADHHIAPAQRLPRRGEEGRRVGLVDDEVADGHYRETQGVISSFRRRSPGISAGRPE